MIQQNYQRVQAPSGLLRHYRRYFSLLALALLATLSACSSSEPELRFSESFIGEHNFTVALNSAGDGLDISFNSQSDASYELFRSSTKACTSSSATDTCADYLDFTITGEGAYSDSLPERTYYYKLAVSLPGISEDFSAQYPPLDPPGSVTASAGDKQITLSWRGVSGASSYNLYGSRSSGITPENYASLEGGFLVSGVTSPHVLDGLTNGATYYLVLTAINADGVASTYSDEVSATPLTPASNNSAPVFTSASTAATSENSTSTFYTATATDANGDLISYSISGGADSARFSLDATSGALRFINAPDYENPSDSDNDNIYNLSLLASDGVDSSATLDLTVSVSNLTELSVEYDLSADAVTIDSSIGVDIPEGALVTLYRADEPFGTATCSVLDGISSCTNGVYWDDTIPSSDAIDWSARRYYQLDVSVDGAIVDRLFADVSVADYLIMNEPTISDDSYEFNLSWQALSNASSYSLYITTDANATGATEANWSSLEGSQIIDAIAEANYSLDPDGASSLYLALRATNTSGAITDLSPLYQLSNIDYSGESISDGSTWAQATGTAAWSARREHTSVVFNDKLWVLGGYDGDYQNDVWYSEDGANWTQATASADWSGRSEHTSAMFQDKLWILGGYGGNSQHDVWYSEDGISWTLATSNAGWSLRYRHTSVVFDGKLWVIGGYDGLNRLNDVWYSEDGSNWTRATENAQWSGRQGHTSVAFDGKLWVIGGYDDGGNRLDDAWYSEDGITWAQAANGADWFARNGHSSAVFDNKIWLFGGSYGGSSYLGEVWYSEDGSTWQQATSKADWPERAGHSSVTFNDQLWVLGGVDNSSSNLNDVWHTNSSDWQQATASAGWSARYDHTSAVFDDKLWVLGGYDGGPEDDVWHSENGADWTRATSIADWSGRYHHTSAVFANRLWVLGGYDGGREDDVWYSDDGIDWTLATATAGWSGRHTHTTEVFDGKLWVLGGYDGSRKEDVWYSADGVDWTQAAASAGWSARNAHAGAVFDDKIWVFGGSDGTNYLNDVWYSADGVTWERVTADADWAARRDHDSIVFDDRLWVFGGYDGSNMLNDIWHSEDGITWTQTTDIVGWSGRSYLKSAVFDNKLWVLGGLDSDNNRLSDVWYYQPTTINTFAFTPLDYNYAPPQNQPPTFTSASATTSAENNLAAYSARADDPDDGTLAFTITGGADAELFSLDSSSGALSFLAAPDYEEPADSNTDNNYELDLQVSDGSAEDQLSLVVSVSNIADDLSAPTGLQASTSGGILSLSWQIVADAESYRVYWDTSSGVGIEQYSDTLSADGNKATISGLSDATTYYFVVTSVSDQGESFESDELRVLMNTSVDNSSPVFTSSNSATVLENTSGVFYTASASDADGDDFSFALSGGADATLFSLDPDSGALSFAEAPDYEAPADSDSDNTYVLTLSVADAYAVVQQSLAISVADMAAGVDFQAEHNTSTNLVDISFNLEDDLSYQLLRSYAADCAHQSIDACNGGVELAYTEADNSASATDSIDFTQTQYYQLVVSDSAGRTELLTATIDGAQQLQDLIDDHQLLVEYNLATDAIDITLTNLLADTSYTLYRAEEPIGTATCSVIDGISACTNGASWSDTAIPSIDTIDWSARNYYQLDISLDAAVVGRLYADVAVSDYLTMSVPTITSSTDELKLSWQALPDVASYSLYITSDANATSATDANWSSLEGSVIVSDLAETSYILNPESNTTLYLALSATNSDGTATALAPLYQLDNIDYSSGSTWVEATDAAGWSARSSHTSVVFADKLWVIGGYDGGREDDVWYSEDGFNWSEATATAGWPSRHAHTSVVFEDKLWVIGGYDGGNSLNDVWYSEDGENWMQTTASVGWSGRYHHASVVFNDKIWIIGGYDGSSWLNDVWYSADGASWTQAAADAAWAERYAHTSVAFDSKIWVLGGKDNSTKYKDVWYSADGLTWEQTTSDTTWNERHSHTSAVLDGVIWVIGGYDDSNKFDDVWHTDDGANWMQATLSADWTDRSHHTSVVFNNQLWILGGNDGSREDDVWYSPLSIDSFVFRALDYDYLPPQNQAPAFTSATSAIADENSLKAYSASGNDPDGGTITFAIAGGADADSLSIDPNSGELSFLIAPDYENPADSDADNVYQLALRLSDGSADSDLEALITVINVNEVPPAPTGLGARMVSDELRLSWDSLPDDTDGDILTYNLYYAQHSGVDAEDHEVRQSNISANSFTFALSNFSADTSYNFVVSATNEIGESAESEELGVLITSGVDNSSPLFTSAESTVVLENTNAAFYTASASDADNDNLAFTISGGADAALFAIGSSSGELRFLTAPDYENPTDSDADNIYSLTLSVADSYSFVEQSLSVSVTDMAASANLQADYNSSVNLVDISFNLEADLSYTLQRSYDPDCDHLQPSNCAGYLELEYTVADTTASAADTLDLTQSQYYQLLASDAEGRTELITAAINGTEQLDDFAAAHQLLVEYNLSTDAVGIRLTNFPDAASYTLYRAQEPIGTETCSVLDDISACSNGASWSDTAIPSTDAIDWSARNYYQLDISVDDIVIDRLTADLAVSDYLTMAEPTVATDGYQFNLSWQALPNLASYSLYIATDSDATSATKSNWVNLEGSAIITDLGVASYTLDPDGNSTIYLALSATNSSGTATALAPLYQLNSIDYVSDGSVWVEATDGADWSGRNELSSSVFDDKIWVIGGYNGSSGLNEVWYSEDGINWNETEATADWSARYDHTSATFNDKLWVLGGYDGSREDDVWYSADGVIWEEATPTAGWVARNEHTSVVFDDQLWVLGGNQGNSRLNEVWYSADGVSWEQTTTEVGWTGRSHHSSVVFDGKIWILGGYHSSSSRSNEIWYSEDGATWEQATADANWSERYSHTSVVFDDKIWVIGGWDGSNRLDEVWHSSDGINWEQTTAGVDWSGRYDHASVVYSNKMWVIGGYDGSSRLNDVWYSPLLINTFNFTPLDYAPAQNQAPTFTSANTTTVDENTITAYTAAGDDPDNGTLAFAIAGGADFDLFTIDASSGELAFLEAPDYENPADSDTDNNYTLTLQLHDGSAATELDLVISVSNVVETLPAPQGLSARMVSDELRLSWENLPDNLDGSTPTYNLYYSQSSGVNSSAYEARQRNIGANTITLNNLGTDTSYYFVVSAENELGESPESDELSVLITSGVDNSSPIFTSAESAAVLENTNAAFYTASASDADNDALAFAIAGGADAALFSFGTNSGELRFITAPDYENPADSDADNIYSLTLSVADTYSVAQYSLSVSVADMAAGANLQAQYNSSTNLVDISFNTESGLSYTLQRSYEADCDHLQASACTGYLELEYTETANTASATDSIDFAQSQYYQLLASDAEGRTELIATSIAGAEQLDDFIAAHQLLVEYNLSSDRVDIHIDNFPEATNASYALYRAEEPLGTDTCSILDGISACTNDASWSDAAIPSTDAIDWSARNYYQLDISVDGIVIDRLTADLAVSDYLTMAEPTISTDGYEFNLSWQALPNVASYSLYIATDANATGATDTNWSSLEGSVIVSDLAETSYILNPESSTTLYLALSATNSSGTSTSLAPLYQLNIIDYVSDGSTWEEATDAAGWSTRNRHTSVVFDNKLWVLGGYDGSREDDVWYSEDGVTWTQAIATAGWSARYNHTSVVFDDKLWVLGGNDGGYEDDVWHSADGITWQQATATAGWSARQNHSSVVFDDKLWVIGGFDGSLEGDVWYSEDGVTWIQATATAGWSGRYDHSSVVFDDKLWVIGGFDGSYKDDVWYSEDGITWQSATAMAGWSTRRRHSSVVFDDKLWIIGGYSGSYEDDVWYSADGESWQEATATAGWSGRSSHTSVVFNDKLWIIGGTNDSIRFDDVWYSPLLINTFTFTPLDYDYAPAQNQAPAFTSATSAIVDENTIDAYTATGTDSDGGTLAFTIAGGADAALFSIEPSSGKLSFNAYPDYENPADSDADNAYQVDLGIHDGSAVGAERSVSITVLNETENPTIPVIVQALAGDSEAILHWQIVNDADEYRVYWSTDSDLSLSNFSDRQDVDSSFTGATISNLNNGTIYYFFVTAVNNLGESAESSVVSVKPQSGDTNQAPTAAAGADQTVSEGKTVYLVGSGSDADGSIVQYTWSSASSSISIVDSDSSDGNASFIAPEVDASGDSFTLTLRVTDDDDASGLDTMTVTVENNEAPTVNAGADQSAVAGTVVRLAGGASDSDGTVVAYSWQETSASSANSGGVSISRSDSARASITVPELDAGDELIFELTATDDDGASASAQTKLTVAASGSFKWSFTTGGSIYSSPAIALDGSIYFGSDDGKLYALHPDGSEDWNYTTGGMVRSAPAIGADGSIYFGSDDNKLYALNPDGSENWNYPTSGVVRSSPALAADGSIYFGSDDGKLYALNPDGSEDWNYTSGNAIHSAPTISSEGMIYFGDSAGVVHELNSSGDVQRFFASAGAIYTPVALDPANDQLYFSNRNGNIYALSTSSATSWDSSLWSFAANNLDSAPVVAEDGTIYIGSFDDARLYALATDGSILSDKFYSSAGAINATATLGADARIYFSSVSSLSSGDGNISALDISSATETKLDWQYDIGWEYVEDAPAASAVAIARDGTVYVGSTDGKLYALHSASAGLASSSWPRFAQDNHNLGRINIAPSAEAGSDQDVAAGAMVNLDGSSSSDSDGAIVDYYWQETSSFGISITNNSSAQASFTAPDDLSTDATLTIQLTVTDNSGATATDTLQISVPAAISDPVAQ